MHVWSVSFVCCLCLFLAACQSKKDRISDREQQLVAAGFAYKSVSTPRQQEMLNTLPQFRFLRRVMGDHIFYIYADPKFCNCLYVGDQDAYARFLRYLQAKQLADEQRMTAMDYQDASWSWGGWGPVGGWYGWNPAWGNWDPGMGFYGW